MGINNPYEFDHSDLQEQSAGDDQLFQRLMARRLAFVALLENPDESKANLVLDMNRSVQEYLDTGEPQ